MRQPGTCLPSRRLHVGMATTATSPLLPEGARPALVCAAPAARRRWRPGVLQAPRRAHLLEGALLDRLGGLGGLALVCVQRQGRAGGVGGAACGAQAPRARMLTAQGRCQAPPGAPARAMRSAGALHVPERPGPPAGAMALAPCSAGIGQRGRAGRGAAARAGVPQQAAHGRRLACGGSPAPNWRASPHCAPPEHPLNAPRPRQPRASRPGAGAAAPAASAPPRRAHRVAGRSTQSRQARQGARRHGHGRQPGRRRAAAGGRRRGQEAALHHPVRLPGLRQDHAAAAHPAQQGGAQVGRRGGGGGGGAAAQPRHAARPAQAPSLPQPPATSPPACLSGCAGALSS